MLGTTGRVRRKSWTVLSAALALLVIAGLTVACHRESPPPPAPLSPAEFQPSPDAQRPADAHPFPDPTFLVLVWMETTPPGAAVVRVSDGYVLGYSPEIIEFRYSKTPVQIRFELEGYIPLTQEVSAAEDSELKVVLEPIPKVDLPATKKSKGSKRHRP